MNDTWGFLPSGFHDAATNMALDEALLQWHSQGKIPPILRFYGWSKPTLSIGRFQRVDRIIDLTAIKKNQCEFVRRQTGGSAVLHDDELTYSLVVSEDKSYISTSIREAYFRLSKGIMTGFKKLGVDANYSIPEEQFKQEHSAVCFEKPSDYEMVVDGKKISGHAQTRASGVLLQHGSIPLSMNKQLLFDLFIFPSEEVREQKRNAFSEKAMTIKEATGTHYTYEAVAKAFKQGFEQGLNLQLVPFELTKLQWEEVHDLANAKYRSDEWNLTHRKKVNINVKA